MSRSYHVTEKKAKIAFAEGDKEPLFAASEKTWVKSAEMDARKTKKVIGKAPTNRASVTREKMRTNTTSSIIRYRTGEFQNRKDESPNQAAEPSRTAVTAPANAGARASGAPGSP